MRSRHLVDPELLPAVSDTPARVFSLDTLAEVRAMVDAMAAGYAAPTDDGISRREVQPAGAPPVRLLVYAPTEPASAPRPAVLYIHGGGYFSGKADGFEPWCRRLARELGAVVVAVDYRKAPEARYPAAIDDCRAALRWLGEQADALGIDPARIAVEGVSAGGGLAAALALSARDRGDTRLAFQSLVYPMLDDRTGRDGQARDPFAGEYVWTYEGNAFGWDTLLGAAAGGGEVSADAAPARADDLSGLAPAWIGVGALDALMRENVDYAMRLIGAGVPAELAVYPGAYHGFDAYDGGASAVGDRFRADRIAALRRGLAVTA